MKKASCVLLVAVMMALAGPAFAGKIAFVDVERAVATVQEGKAKLDELRAWAEPNDKQIDDLAKRVLDLQRQILQQRAVASSDALKRLEEEELDGRRRLEDLRRDLSREFETRQNQLLLDVARKLNQVVTDYATANDYDAVFIHKGSTLIYMAPAADLTDTVIRLYDERFPVR
jgi:Skp family chaperone for outer membrane proteins